MFGLELFGLLSFCLDGDFGSSNVVGFESFLFGLVVLGRSKFLVNYGQVSLKNNFFVASLLTKTSNPLIYP